MRNLYESVASGKPLSTDGLRLFMYGIYLSNGGTPEDYMTLDDDDLDAMYIAYSAEKAHEHNQWMEGLVDIVKAIFGAD